LLWPFIFARVRWCEVNRLMECFASTP
jgi:hypothetical protein